MKILVTGSSGFIGEYIVKNLSKKNEVIATCYKIKKEKKIKKIKYIKFNKDTLENTNNIDAIVHCALVLHQNTLSYNVTKIIKLLMT